MSNTAVAHGQPNFEFRITPPSAPRKRQAKSVATTAHLPWSSVALRSDIAASGGLANIKRPPGYVWALAAAALALHAGFAWYLHTYASSAIVKPKPAEIALQFERPAPPPKVEPPKPEPKREQPKQAQILPPIQTATPEPSSEPAAPSVEPPVAVAPIVSAPPAPPPPLPISAPIGRAGYLNNPPPDYPAAALRQGWQGTVILHVHVLPNGKPDIVEVQKSSGRKLLDDEAIRTVKNLWSYTPAKRGETPVEGWTTTPIEFQIDS